RYLSLARIWVCVVATHEQTAQFAFFPLFYLTSFASTVISKPSSASSLFRPRCSTCLQEVQRGFFFSLPSLANRLFCSTPTLQPRSRGFPRSGNRPALAGRVSGPQFAALFSPVHGASRGLA